jgi:hypothetical protein
MQRKVEHHQACVTGKDVSTAGRYPARLLPISAKSPGKFLDAPIGKIGVHDEQGVKHAGYPK